MNSPSDDFQMWQEASSLSRDGEGESLTWQPMQTPSEGFVMHQEEEKALPPAKAEPKAAPPTPTCIKADVDSVVADPVSNPYNLGDTITFTGFGVTGTAPITYEWFINAASVSTSYPFIYTLVDGDITDKDASGLGKLKIYLVVKNACNTTGTSTNVDGSFNAQGTPPP